MRDTPLKSLAVGFFDGVHRGHQAILQGASAALTFRTHPLSVLAPDRAPPLIMTCARRVAAMKACGVGEVMVLDFTPDLATLSPEDFFARFLLAGGFSSIRCGADWRFGRDGAGDVAFLRAKGMPVEVVPAVAFKGARISSSRIRTCLARGEVEEANAMLGRAFDVQGVREKGKGVGTSLGYPTVNLRLTDVSLRLPHGVYAVEVAGELAIANYGVAPTMGARAWETPLLEIHFLQSVPASVPDFSVRILRFIRPERRFNSVEALRRQIALDLDAFDAVSKGSPLLG